MLSQLTEAMIVNGVVLATVLATDLGPARKITPLRLLRPVAHSSLASVSPALRQRRLGRSKGHQAGVRATRPE